MYMYATVCLLLLLWPDTVSQSVAAVYDRSCILSYSFLPVGLWLILCGCLLVFASDPVGCGVDTVGILSAPLMVCDGCERPEGRSCGGTSPGQG